MQYASRYVILDSGADSILLSAFIHGFIPFGEGILRHEEAAN